LGEVIQIYLLVLAAGGVSVPMPPPPPGMVALQAEPPGLAAKATAAPAVVADEKKNDDDDELEQMRAAEELAFDQAPARTRPASAASWKSSGWAARTLAAFGGDRARRGLGRDAGQPARPGDQPARARHRGAAVGIRHSDRDAAAGGAVRSLLSDRRAKVVSAVDVALDPLHPMMTPILEAHGLRATWCTCR